VTHPPDQALAELRGRLAERAQLADGVALLVHDRLEIAGIVEVSEDARGARERELRRAEPEEDPIDGRHVVVGGGAAHVAQQMFRGAAEAALRLAHEADHQGEGVPRRRQHVLLQDVLVFRGQAVEDALEADVAEGLADEPERRTQGRAFDPRGRDRGDDRDRPLCIVDVRHQSAMVAPAG